MGLVLGLSVSAAISGAVCIGGKYRGSSMQVFVFKPLTTILLLTAAFAAGAIETSYGTLVLVALVFSLFGDIFLMLPKDHFIHGLLSFLMAHLTLIIAFTLRWPGVNLWLFLTVALPALGMYAVLAPHLGRMKTPVAAYISVIGTMTWFGCERWLEHPSISALLAAAGAILFMISDSTLALNRFRTQFHGADLIVLSTYWVSLWLIALSVHPGWM